MALLLLSKMIRIPGHSPTKTDFGSLSQALGSFQRSKAIAARYSCRDDEWVGYKVFFEYRPTD